MSSKGLGALGALVSSIFGRRIDYFPRSDGDASASRADTFMPEIGAALAKWTDVHATTSCSIDDALDLAKASLAEVKAQTEYQDNKAARLLTVTSFVSALAGFLFTVFNANYPMDSLHPWQDDWHLLPIAAYLVFLLFVLSALSGAVVTFHATRTRFKYPSSPKPGQDGRPLSHLFHSGIIGVSPVAWTDSFVEERGGRLEFRDLKATYLRNYVSETYLVAAKTADKLRYLQPAQGLLSLALRFLLGFVLLFAVVAFAVAPTKPQPKPTNVILGQPTAVLRVNAAVRQVR